MIVAFNPTANAADAIAAFDVAPLEVLWDLGEATSLIERVGVIRRYIPGCKLSVAVSVAKTLRRSTP